MTTYTPATPSGVSDLYWIPHVTYVWAVARYLSKDLYVLESPIDTALGEKDLALDLSSASLNYIASCLKDVSESVAKAIQENRIEDLIVPISNSDDLTGPDNICHLTNVCEASVLHSLRERYTRDCIYSNVGRIVIAMNPFMEITGLYGSRAVTEYSQVDNPYRLSPHIYQVAGAAFKCISEGRPYQAILITGESGSGKTESTKLILEFLVQASSRYSGILSKKSSVSLGYRGGSTLKQLQSRRTFHKSNTRRAIKTGAAEFRSTAIEDKLLCVNSLLESFGNATTSRNPNSSRFGKWIEIHFDRSNTLVGASITAYLLELPRVTQHLHGERGYHVFYQFLLALEHELASLVSNYELTPGHSGISNYRYLVPTGPEMKSAMMTTVDDNKGFDELRTSLSALRFEPQEQDCLFSIVAALLHVGNLEFESTQQRQGVEGCSLTEDCNSHLQLVSRLLQIEATLVRRCVEFRELKTVGECIQVPLKMAEANAARDGFSKLIYGCVFDWILHKANAGLQMQSGQYEISTDSSFIGILDVAGFESFVVNGFEQLCINLANEKLQCQFNWDIFQAELNAYAEEGLESLDINVSDNSDILELIEGKRGLIALLDEELFVPRGSDAGFVSKFTQAAADHPRMIKSKMRDALQFTISHFASPVVYTAAGWLEKNQYAPPKLAIAALQTSKNPVVQAMISDTVTQRLQEPSRKSGRATVGNCFKQDLERLMTKIRSTEIHYIRCIKPNAQMAPRTTDASEVLRQLRCSGAMEAIKIRKAGFPVRMLHTEFLTRYAIIYGRRFSTLTCMEDTAAACQALMDHVTTSFGLPSADMVVGYTRVFLTDSVHESLNQFRNLAMAGPATRIQAAFRGYRVRKHASQAFELARQLGPLLGVGAAALRQGGFLYPVSVIGGVYTPSDLAPYVDSMGALLDKFAYLPPEFQPSTLTKAVDIYESMHREAEVLMESERLAQEESLHMGKLTALTEKAARYGIQHPLVSQLKSRVELIQFELGIAANAECCFQNNKDIAVIDDLLLQIDEHLAKTGFNECLTKPLRRLVPQLRSLQESYYNAAGDATPTLDVAYSDELNRAVYVLDSRAEEKRSVDAETLQTQDAGPTHQVNFDDNHEEATYSNESSDWDWSSSEEDVLSKTEEDSDEAEYEARSSSIMGSVPTSKSLPTSAAKFMKELRLAVAVLDVERLDILLQAYEESGLLRRHSREYLHAKEVRSNLDIPDWIIAEIKEAVVSVVWGTNNHTSVLRLTNLIKHADVLGLEGPDVDSGKKALGCLRASPASLRKGVSQTRSTGERGAEKMSIVTALDVVQYPGLRVNQKKQPRFFLSFFGIKRATTPEVVCSHTYDRLRESLTVLEKNSPEERVAFDLFRLIQSYMGDRPHAAHDYLADDIVSCGLALASIRDELYLQLMKQLTGNPRPLSETRGWSLMLYCCQNFVPSAELQPYVRYFLFQRTAAIGDFSGGIFDENGEIAKQALKEFERTAASRITWTRPRRPDVVADSEEPDKADEWVADIMVRLMDESRQKVSIDYYTTIADVITEICGRFNMDTAGWTIMVLYEVDDSTFASTFPLLDVLGFDLLSQKVVQSALYALWRFPQFHVIQEDQRVWDIWDPSTEDFPKLLFRRRLISTSEMLYPHPYHAHLTYKQLLWEFRKYPVAEPMSVLATVIARILVAEKWAPSSVAYETGAEPPRSHALADRGGAFGFEMTTRAAVRALAITYNLLESYGYIPSVYATQHPRFREEWELQVQRVYVTLDPDEHQLLAINSVLTDMRQLKAFGALCWLVVEPSKRIFDAILVNSQLRAAYENTQIQIESGVLRARFAGRDTSKPQMLDEEGAENEAGIMRPWDDHAMCLQPMVITPRDLFRLREELETEAAEKQALVRDSPDGSARRRWIKLLWRRLLRRTAQRNQQGTTEHGFKEAEFAAGSNPGEELHQPLWMTFNSNGLQFCPAVSYGYSNWTSVDPVVIPANQLFACETLWTYHSPSQTWTYAGLLLCVDIRSDETAPPQWCLLAVIPMTCSAAAIHAALRAYIPSLASYGEAPAAETPGDEGNEPEIEQAEVYDESAQSEATRDVDETKTADQTTYPDTADELYPPALDSWDGQQEVGE